jgi:hypothetical protein
MVKLMMISISLLTGLKLNNWFEISRSFLLPALLLFVINHVYFEIIDINSGGEVST